MAKVKSNDDSRAKHKANTRPTHAASVLAAKLMAVRRLVQKVHTFVLQ